MVKEAWEYDYSSAAYYALGKDDELVTDNLYYEGLGKSAEDRRERYRDFLLLDDPYSTMIDQQLTKV